MALNYRAVSGSDRMQALNEPYHLSYESVEYRIRSLRSCERIAILNDVNQSMFRTALCSIFVAVHLKAKIIPSSE
jgi:translation elongation factor EF-4